MLDAMTDERTEVDDMDEAQREGRGRGGVAVLLSAVLILL